MQPTLICFPFAGGSATSLLPLTNCLKEDFTIEPVNYPGRGRRTTESLLYHLQDLAEDAFKQIENHLRPPYYLFGHSMGGLLMFLITHIIQEKKLPSPAHLFISGMACPSVPYKKREHLLSKEDLRKILKEYGGMPAEILNSEEYFSFFEPIIRADMQAVETWRYNPLPRLSIPTTILTGKEDDLTEEEITGWQKEFSNDISFEQFSGGHFFIFDHAKEVADCMLYQAF